MALWGNKDAGIGTMGLGSALSVDYGTLTVTGSGTTFGRTGAAATGDIIVFGDRTGVASTYFGTAVITAIASTTSLSIGSSAALNGSPVSNISVWKVNESPIYQTWDIEYSARLNSDFNATGLQTYYNANMSFGISTTNGIGCGVSVINLSGNDTDSDYSGLQVGDFVQLSDGTDWYDHRVTAVNQASTSNMDAVSTGGTVIRTPSINGLGVGDYLVGSPSPITGVGETIALLTAEAIVGIETLSFNVTGVLPMVGDTVVYPTADADGTIDSVASGSVGIAASLSASITAGLGVTIQSVYGTTPEIYCLGGAVAGAIGASDELQWTTLDNAGTGWVSLGTTVFAGSGNAAVAINAGSAVRLARSNDGYDAYVYGISDAMAGAALSTAYETDAGWVGVTTYTGNDGELRDKKEVLVAMSGITTENRPPFPAYPNVAQ